MDYKLNLTQKFLDLDGKPMKVSDTKDLDVREAIKITVTAELQSDTQGSPQDVVTKKMNNFEIFLKVRDMDTDTVDLTSEEVTHLKDRIPFVLHVLALGPLMNMLNGKEPYARKVKA